MEASLKEKAVFAGLGVFLAYALGAGWWMMSGKASIEDAKKQMERAKSICEREKRLISERPEWDERYEEEAALIPEVGDGDNSDTVWMSVMDKIAQDNSVFITERRPGKEEMSGDMQQTTVDIKWTAALESLVKFMHELENTDDGKFDIQSLSFSPGKRKGFLSGTLTLTCIFKRN